jgi:hypothetical protein
MVRVQKPRFKKSRPAAIHIGKPIPATGWRLPCKWVITAKRGFGGAYQKMGLVRKTLEDARSTAKELIERGWDSVEYKQQEILLPLRKS